MNQIWVLGNGQLGAMMQHAAMPLALTVNTVDIHATEVPVIADDDIITVELEHWPDTPVTQSLNAHPNFLNRETLTVFADRAIQKRLLDQLGLPHANWQMVDSQTTQTSLHQNLAGKVLLKRRKGGYDGKGQLWLKQHEDQAIPSDWLNQSIAEQGIDFDGEVSIVGARNQSGQCVFYPVTSNLHYQGILLASVASNTLNTELQTQAQTLLQTLMDHFNYVGVMTMECFKLGDQLLINEIAPRVHNSGHWTQAGASISQFEMHLRAICDLPLITPRVKSANVMINLLGMPYQPKWLGVAGAEVYWYGKSVKPMRKLGHINFCLNDDKTPDLTSLDTLTNLLDNYYGQAIDWCKSQF